MDPHSDLYGPTLEALHHKPVSVERVAVALLFTVVALGAIVVGSEYGDVHSAQLHTRIIAWVGAVVFLLFGVLSTRRSGSIFGDIVSKGRIPTAGTAVRLIVSIVGYIIVSFATLGVLDVSIEHLLIGGALTGVVLGIAAQQSLGNVFAGLVLLLARPFDTGDHILIRSGALGGEFDGVVLAMSLTYVTISRVGVPMKIPNSGMLAAAVGPYVAKPAPPPNS